MTAHAADGSGGPRSVTVDSRSIWSDAATSFTAWRDDDDAAALERLVRRLTPCLWHIVRAYGLSRPQAEDVVQTTWLALMHKAATINDPQAVGKWISTVARREAWRVSSDARRETELEPATAEAHTGAVPDTAAQVVLQDAERRLWEHVGELPERCRRLLRVIAFDDRPDYASLSTQLGLPVGAIGPTRGRCLAKLRHRLDADPRWSDR